MTQLSPIISILFSLIISFQLFGQTNKATHFDTTIYSRQTVIIQGKKYNGFLSQNGFRLLNFKNEILVKQSGDYFTWDFKDFNNDGYKDIFLDRGGNTPERFDLLLYIPTTHSFKIVKDFENFPAPEQISGTKYYYSYHKSGCADMDWGSDLFYIQNYMVVRIGNISGYECDDSGIKDGLYISKLRDNKKVLFKTLPINTIHTYKENKWGFIKEYWTKNYKLFL